MKKQAMVLFIVTAIVLGGGLTGTKALALKAPNFDTEKVEKILGAKGAYTEEEGVLKVSFPRNDVPISVDGAKLPPFMGLTSWVAFSKPGRQTMLMGDLVLFQDEVNPVMSALLANNVQVTALHNHFFFDEPKVYFMHVSGEAAEDLLASGARKALDKVKEIRASNRSPATSFGGPVLPSKSSITAKPLEEILGVQGLSKEGMFKAVIGRKVEMACGCEMGKEMGVNTWAAFLGTDENSVVDGDFAVLEGELQDVLKTLRSAGINIVAIHHHMTLEKPKMLFLHYWGKGKAADLAKAVRQAVDTQGQS